MGNGDIAKPVQRSFSGAPLVLLALAIGLGVGFAAGWFSRGNTLPDLVVQKGSVSLVKDEEKEIHYPRPYTAPPALKISAENAVALIDQNANGFKVRAKPTTNSVTFEWQTEGVPAK
jgi:hypothetical protein